YSANSLNQYDQITIGTQTETPEYDEDGNMTAYKGRKNIYSAENRLISSEPEIKDSGKKVEFVYDYTGRRVKKTVSVWNGSLWDTEAEKRLIVSEPEISNSGKKVEFVYDYMGRRVKKTVSAWNGSSWTTETEKLFIYDGWNMICEITVPKDQPGQPATEKYFVWGLDLSQSLQGAGGIGGLLASLDKSSPTVYYYLYDANGNVGQLVSADGSIAARYEYDPYGNETVADGTEAVSNVYRFSTKFFDVETELYYYGFRYYLLELGRWISRDPIENIKLYTYIENNSLNNKDYLGMYTIAEAVALEFPKEKLFKYPEPMENNLKAKALRKKWHEKYNLTFQKVFDIWHKWEKNRGKWWKNLPKCPNRLCLIKGKTQNPDKNKWENPGKPSYAE
ncbi:MAG: RHS repeat-associated core domain-containing protein, partial [Desulfobacteraceae bacterium]|nr:RHS repeat-associated core domain-containing protein [Desulfobacteraceae bacterium]